MIRAVAIPSEFVVDPSSELDPPETHPPGRFFPGSHIPRTDNWRVLENKSFALAFDALDQAQDILDAGFAATRHSTENETIRQKGVI